MTEPTPIFKERASANSFCVTPTATAIFEVLKLCISDNKLGLIIGEPGVGKTTALQRFEETMPEVVMITMSPALRSMTAALASVCDGLGITSPPARRGDLHYVLVNHLTRHTVSLLIVDEAHHLGDDVIDELRCIYDATCVPILFCGNSMFSSRFGKTRKGFGQVISRISSPLVLKGPSLGDVAAICLNEGITDAKVRALLAKHSESTGALRTARLLMEHGIRLAGSPQALRVKHIEDAQSLLGGDL